MAITFRETTLPNGLKILAEVDDAAHSAAAGFFVKTGARDEQTPLMGVSHFLEHMMFKGTPSRTAEQINQGFDRLGARNNAYTSAEMTCFYATVLPEFLLGQDGVLEVLSDMMRPALRQSDFDTEKNVILEEIAMYDDNPFWVLYERALEEHFERHPLGHRVLGTKESITDLSSHSMRRYFEDRYSADNTVLALAGKIDFDAAVKEVARHCGSWQTTGATRDPKGPPISDKVFEIRDEKVSRAYMLATWSAPAMTDERRYAASLLSQVLGAHDNSRLHWSLIEPGLADEAEASYDGRDGVGDFMLYVSCDPEKKDQVWEIVEKELAGLEASLKEEDLERIRAKAATAVVLAGERPGGRMQRLGRQWTNLGAYTTLEEELEKINRVTVDDLRGILRDFPLRPRTFGTLLPKE